MIVIRKTHLLRITSDLSVLLISVGMCRVVSHDSNVSKITRIGLQMAEKQLKYQTRSLMCLFSATGPILLMERIQFRVGGHGSGLICLQIGCNEHNPAPRQIGSESRVVITSQIDFLVEGICRTVRRFIRVGYNSAESYPSRHLPRRPNSKDPLRNDRLGLDSELTRPSYDMIRTDSADSIESAPSQGRVS